YRRPPHGLAEQRADRAGAQRAPRPLLAHASRRRTRGRYEAGAFVSGRISGFVTWQRRSSTPMSSPRASSRPSPPRVLVRSEESGGRVAVIESTMAPAAKGPPLHTHTFDETFYTPGGGAPRPAGQGARVGGRGGGPFRLGGKPPPASKHGGPPAAFPARRPAGGVGARFPPPCGSSREDRTAGLGDAADS